jgi:hypothetical protein
VLVEFEEDEALGQRDTATAGFHLGACQALKLPERSPVVAYLLIRHRSP